MLSRKGKVQNGMYSMFPLDFFKGGKYICKYLLVYEYLNKIKQTLSEPLNW